VSFPNPAVLPYSMQSDMGTAIGTHLDANFVALRDVLNATLTQLELIQRDDGDVRDSTVHSDAFTSDALALMAGSSGASTDLDWRPRGNWAAATLYEPGNIVQTGAPAVAYVCVSEHVSTASFATDYANNRWVVLSSPRTLISADVISALSYTPVNIAGDTMQGALALTTGSSIAGVTFTDTLLTQQDLVTINKGLYSAYESSAGDYIYGFAANVVRAGGSGLTVGAQCSALGLSGSPSTMFGANFNAFGLSGFSKALRGIEIDVCSFTPNNDATKWGLNVIFFDRAGTNPGEYNYPLPSGTYTSAGGGLGSNYYNKNAKAIVIESQQPSATAEFCGWTRGISFGDYCFSPEIDLTFTGLIAYPIGIDFSELHYYGGTDPVTSFKLEAAIALRDLQTIWWNRDPATAGTTGNKVKTYFNPAVSRFVLANGNTERFGIDVSTGDLYLNGSILVSPSLVGNNVWSGTNTFNNQVNIGANLGFLGNARRITGDFSNGTVPNRVIVQTSSANSATEFGVMPNGSGGISAVYLLDSSAAANCRVGRISVDSTQFQIASGILGAAGYVPMTFGVAGIEAMRIHGSGQLLIAQTTPALTGAALGVNGIIQCTNPVAFSVHRNGVNFVVANNTPTAIDFTTEVFDTNNSYDTATDHFTPPAGKYLLTGACLAPVSVDQGAIVVSIYKNGALERSGNVATMSGAGATGSCVTCIVNANGTDFYQLYVTHVTGAPLGMDGGAANTWFQGYRIG
jgi:hypothetical protein